MLKLAKKDFYANQFKNSKGNMKKTWNVINHALGKQFRKSNITSIQFNGDRFNENMEICNLFNNHFINIGIDLNRSVPSYPNESYCKYISVNYQTAYFKPITNHEIITVVDNLKSTTSAGYDGIDVKILKRVIHIISSHLCAIFNQCLEYGVFPDKLKIARVIPIFKNGSPELMTNYRPISVLPVFSKILEKCIYSRLLKFCQKCDIINKNQYGFRAGFSTTSALLDFVHKVSNAIDKKETTIGLFLDLSKAFDSLDHNILLDKLQHYGIRGITLKLFENYLSKRNQFVAIGGDTSHLQLIQCGVPQGSILGPLLFLLYINDITHSSSLLKCILFADDTSVFLSHKDIDVLQANFNRELELITLWLGLNKLTVNKTKTNYMIFTNKSINFDNISIKMGDSIIKRVNTTKFLGINIDDKLSWSTHIGAICNKLCKNVGVMYKLKFLPKHILKMIYNSIIVPYIYYGITVWGNAFSTYLDRIIKLQKRVVRIIMSCSYTSHTTPLFFSLKYLKFSDLYLYEVCIFMYLCMNNLIPISLSELFCLNSSIHSYPTRNASSFHLPLIRTQLFQRTIFYKGPVLWNSMPSEIKSAPTFNSFKSRLRRFLVGRYK